MQTYMATNPRYGFCALFARVRDQTQPSGKTVLWCVYCQLNLNLPRRGKINREALRNEIDTSLPAARVIRALNELVEVPVAPLSIRLDNGPEFIAHALAEWAKTRGIALNHIQPGKPTQNAYVDRFNRTYRNEVLDCYVFDSLQEVRDMTADRLHRYNHHRPHEALGSIPPVGYRVKQFPNLYF